LAESANSAWHVGSGRDEKPALRRVRLCKGAGILSILESITGTVFNPETIGRYALGLSVAVPPVFAATSDKKVSVRVKLS